MCDGQRPDNTGKLLRLWRSRGFVVGLLDHVLATSRIRTAEDLTTPAAEPQILQVAWVACRLRDGSGLWVWRQLRGSGPS